MFNLLRVLKPWKEAASLSSHLNLYGFLNEVSFLTKSGDVGMVLRVAGVDYESLDHAAQAYSVKRLESALKGFGPRFHVYQYLFKSDRPEIPFKRYDDPVVQAAVEWRRRFFQEKSSALYEIEIYYCVLLENAYSQPGFRSALAQLFHEPSEGAREWKRQFSTRDMKSLLHSQLDQQFAQLNQQVLAFARQLGDMVRVEVLGQDEQFRFFRRLLNYDEWRIAGCPKDTQFLDQQVVNSDIEAERDHLRVGDHYVRVLTMKEAIAETRPLVLDALLKLPASFCAVTEWTPLSADEARKQVTKRRRHFNIAKTGFVSQLANDPARTSARDVLVDESQQADIETLGDCLRLLGEGQQLGEFL